MIIDTTIEELPPAYTANNPAGPKKTCGPDDPHASGFMTTGATIPGSNFPSPPLATGTAPSGQEVKP